MSDSASSSSSSSSSVSGRGKPPGVPIEDVDAYNGGDGSRSRMIDMRHADVVNDPWVCEAASLLSSSVWDVVCERFVDLGTTDWTRSFRRAFRRTLRPLGVTAMYLAPPHARSVLPFGIGFAVAQGLQPERVVCDVVRALLPIDIVVPGVVATPCSDDTFFADYWSRTAALSSESVRHVAKHFEGCTIVASELHTARPAMRMELQSADQLRECVAWLTPFAFDASLQPSVSLYTCGRFVRKDATGIGTCVRVGKKVFTALHVLHGCAQGGEATCEGCGGVCLCANPVAFDGCRRDPRCDVVAMRDGACARYRVVRARIADRVDNDTKHVAECVIVETSVLPPDCQIHTSVTCPVLQLPCKYDRVFTPFMWQRGVWFMWSRMRKRVVELDPPVRWNMYGVLQEAVRGGGTRGVRVRGACSFDVDMRQLGTPLPIASDSGGPLCCRLGDGRLLGFGVLHMGPSDSRYTEQSRRLVFGIVPIVACDADAGVSVSLRGDVQQHIDSLVRTITCDGLDDAMRGTMSYAAMWRDVWTGSAFDEQNDYVWFAMPDGRPLLHGAWQSKGWWKLRLASLTIAENVPFFFVVHRQRVRTSITIDDVEIVPRANGPSRPWERNDNASIVGANTAAAASSSSSTAHTASSSASS